MKPRLIVHIGTPKTGTSSIQRSLFDARAPLRANVGALYANTERSGANAHTKHLSVTRVANAGDAIKQGAEHKALMEDFESSGANVMIISEEQLSSPKERIVKFFKRFVNDFDIEVICYLRRQDYFIESLYNQVMRLRNFQNIPPITEFWRDDRFRERLNYHRMLSWWAELPARVIAVDFSKEVKEHGLLPSFLRAASLEEFGELPEKRSNESSDLRLLLALGMLTRGRTDGDHQRLIQGMMRAAKGLELRGMYKPLKTILGSDERELLLSSCDVTNEALAEDFGTRFGDDRPTEPEKPTIEPDAAYLLALFGELGATDGTRVINRCRAQLQMEMEKLPPPEVKPKKEKDKKKDKDKDDATSAGHRPSAREDVHVENESIVAF